jgi:NitT/TauT family transport system permease protein
VVDAAQPPAVSAVGDHAKVRTPADAAKSGGFRRDLIANALVIAVLIAAMQAWSWMAPPYIMPPPEQSAEATIEALRSDYVHIFYTLGRLTASVVFALVVGSILGAIMAVIRPLQPYLMSVVVIDTGVPALSWMLFAVFWFKDPETRVFFILAMILIPFYALNVYDGIRALSKDLVEMVETFRPTRLQVFRHLILPHVVPYILMTTKAIIGYATRMTAFAELVSVNTGMGARMGLAQNNLAMDGVIAWTVLLVVLNLAIQGLVALAERALLQYRPEVSVR